MNVNAVEGAEEDSYRFNPWRAPGHAPVVDAWFVYPRDFTFMHHALLVPQGPASIIYPSERALTTADRHCCLRRTASCGAIIIQWDGGWQTEDAKDWWRKSLPSQYAK